MMFMSCSHSQNFRFETTLRISGTVHHYWYSCYDILKFEVRSGVQVKVRDLIWSLIVILMIVGDCDMWVN